MALTEDDLEVLDRSYLPRRDVNELGDRIVDQLKPELRLIRRDMVRGHKRFEQHEVRLRRLERFYYRNGGNGGGAPPIDWKALGIKIGLPTAGGGGIIMFIILILLEICGVINIW